MITKIGKKTSIKAYKFDHTVMTGVEVNFVTDGCTYFFNAQHKFLNLSTIERSYFDYMCERMNARNMIELKPAFRQQYISFHKAISGVSKVRTPRSLINAENKFKKLDLMFLNPENPQLHCVNPKHVFKGLASERKALLKKLLDLGTNANDTHLLKCLLDKPLEKLDPSKELLSMPIPSDYVPYVETFEPVTEIRDRKSEKKSPRVRYLKKSDK